MSTTDAAPVRHVGRAIVETLEAHGVERVFEVPGESFLPMLDGLHGSSIQTVVCRQEGGAAFMAEASAKLTGRPGVAIVTRGPGAANAFVGVHVAWQDATPMVLFVGLIPFADRDRESFQEFDPKAWFGTQAKKVFVLDDPSSASRVVAEAFRVASSGRPGPVVVGLPEDIAYAAFDGEVVAPVPLPVSGVAEPAWEALAADLGASRRPVLFVGGPGWTQQVGESVARFAEANHIPVLHDWHAGDRIRSDSPANAGWLGYGRSDDAVRLFRDADVVVSVGALPRDVSSEGFTARPTGTHWVVSTDAELLGRSSAVTGHLLADPAAFAARAGGVVLDGVTERAEHFAAAREAYDAFRTPAASEGGEGPITGDELMAALLPELPDDVITCVGAGNHSLWPLQYVPCQRFPAQLATGNGTMGYSVPSAVAAGLVEPGRFVLCVTGDGDFLMNGQELATAAQYGAPLLVVLADNGEFATIRGHQIAHFPGRVVGTQVTNPDFAAYGEAMGARAWRVTERSELRGALSDAVAHVTAGGIGFVHVRTAQLQEEATGSGTRS